MSLISIREFSKKHFAWVTSMGWVGNKTPLESLMLIVSECGEAANEVRGDQPTEHFGSELADIVLRTMALAEEMNVDLEAELILKMNHNLAKGKKEGRLK